jgi:hypothetical protein
MKVGPTPIIQCPECAGDRKGTRAISPNPDFCEKPSPGVKTGEVKTKGKTGRTIRFKSLVRWSGNTGWKFKTLWKRVLSDGAPSRKKLLNWNVRLHTLETGFESSLVSLSKSCSLPPSVEAVLVDASPALIGSSASMTLTTNRVITAHTKMRDNKVLLIVLPSFIIKFIKSIN